MKVPDSIAAGAGPPAVFVGRRNTFHDMRTRQHYGEVAACYPPDDKQERSRDKSRQILGCTIEAGLFGPSFEEKAALWGITSARHVDVSSSAKIAGGLEASEALHTTTSGFEVTITMTTLMEDVSNMCWACGSAGRSDGVMTFRKTSDIWIGVERCWPT